jgi:hypothetical protein
MPYCLVLKKSNVNIPPVQKGGFKMADVYVRVKCRKWRFEAAMCDEKNCLG